MISREVTIVEVLDFREEKAGIQRELYAGYPEGTVVSLGMNIPGPVKCGSSVYRAFCEGKRELLRVILEQGGTIIQEKVLEEKAGYAAIYVVSGIERKKLKKMAVELEETHALGRLFDVDVLKHDMESLSRTEIGAAQRKCLLCNQDAKICGRSRAHTVRELQEKTASVIRDWEEGRNREKDPARSIGAKAMQALLEEVYTTPKPGLVDLYSCGAHRDMEVSAFEKSAVALHPYFVRMAASGYEMCASPEELFKAIRNTGKEAEQAMYGATGGVNTHKGLLFTLGIFCAAAGRCVREYGTITEELIFDMEQRMVADTLSGECKWIEQKEPESHGEKNLQQYGTAGIRGEAIKGYPSIRYTALPVLRQGALEGKEWNLVKLQTLLHLMSEAEDSNIISRQNPQILCQVHMEAKQFLKQGGAYAEGAVKALQTMDQDYIRRNISAGGCADLLAAAIFIESILDTDTPGPQNRMERERDDLGRKTICRKRTGEIKTVSEANEVGI